MATSTAWMHGPTTVEHFLQTYYKEDSLVKEEVATQLKNKASKVMAACGEAYVMQIEEWAKAECQCHAAKAKNELDGLHNPSDSVKLQYIEGLGGVAGQLLETIHETTGWHGSIYLDGPDPCVNGDVHVFSFHHGKGSTGFTFCSSLPDHTKQIVEPFMMFLKGAFTDSTTSAPPEVLCSEEDIDLFSGADVLKSTPSLTEAYTNTAITLVQGPSTSKSSPILESGVSIQPGDDELHSVILPPSNDPNGYTFPSYFESGLYKSLKTLNPYMTDVSLPEPEHNTV